ncbi:MlaD family protein [Nocardia bovistercoris]|uniref:MCE family protein n=1 Tax=Nocardia bovistercoris TaxID=2785916 RepID=A0A931N2C6_9NOCA|nr:MCE family protein [Nocardia bovistercoris]MBH0776602.1 MCE family protein [Nocardia bovistercoris]
MPIAFESDGKHVSDARLLARGLVFLVVVTAVVAALLARAQGHFDRPVEVTAELVNVGDGLPDNSDVKYHGILVGRVTGVAAAAAQSPNRVRLALRKEFVDAIPGTVTARVVPSNVFAVPSVQLVDNGPGPALRAGARIPEDRSLATVRLQTSLDALEQIAAAAGRPGSDPTVGILTTVEQATSGRGDAAMRAAGQLRRIVTELHAATTPDGTASTLDTLATAITELQSSAPDLLDGLHSAVVPMRAVAEKREQLTALLTGGVHTTTTLGGALERRGDTMLDITSKLGPTLDVLAHGTASAVQIGTSQTHMTDKFGESFDTRTQNSLARVILELTPHKEYTRADCPRYGTLEGPSCRTAPIDGPSVLARPAADIAGGPEQRQRITELLGGQSNTLSDLLIGPLVRDGATDREASR